LPVPGRPGEVVVDRLRS